MARMSFDASKKSLGLAYAFWALLGWIGAHRYYLGRLRSGTAMLLLLLLMLLLYIEQMTGMFYFASAYAQNPQEALQLMDVLILFPRAVLVVLVVWWFGG